MSKKSGNIPRPQDQRQAVKQAMALHQAGDYEAAFEAYTKVLARNAYDLDALMNLSTLQYERGNNEEAARLLKTLLPLTPKLAYPRFAYGNALMKLLKYDEALESFSQAIKRDEKNASYHYNQGAAYDALNRFEEAVASYSRALALEPGHIPSLVNRANDYYRLGRAVEAVEDCTQALALNPVLPLAYTTRASAYAMLGETAKAASDYEYAIRFDPDSAVAHNNRGNLFKDQNEPEQALASYDHAIRLSPAYADAYTNRGAALNKLERFADALVSSATALSLQPDSAIAYDTRANALAGMRRFDEALSHYNRSLALDPGQVDSYWNKAMLMLLLGEYDEGWKLYEHRWRTSFQKDQLRHFDVPLWLGDAPLEGKTILIHPEQGFGDSIQFCRYVPLLVARGAKVIFETQGPLLPLLEPCLASENVTLVAYQSGNPLPLFDYHCPIMSLPLAFGTRVDTIPNQVPYLKASVEKKAEWQKRLGPKRAARIGLAWSGAAIHINDRNRSIPLSNLAPLLDLPFEFHALQKEIRASDQLYLGAIKTHASQLHDFSDTAALVDEMDLIISVDTSLVHLAGAMDKPVWVMLPYAPDYRWLLNRSDSPWYPSATLFRQPERGDWQGLLSQMTALLRAVFS